MKTTVGERPIAKDYAPEKTVFENKTSFKRESCLCPSPYLTKGRLGGVVSYDSSKPNSPCPLFIKEGVQFLPLPLFKGRLGGVMSARQ
ncbi:MAG: hypothetical protein HZB85_04090 [Deltaproteobacteria bacterium]|nr:hypothetical protein [Deltaproteobacteria bacterium]